MPTVLILISWPSGEPAGNYTRIRPGFFGFFFLEIWLIMDIERTCALYHPGSETGQSKIEAYNFKILYCFFP